MFSEYDNSQVRMWIADASVVHLKAGGTHDDGVKLTPEQARAVSRDLLELSIQLEYGEKANPDWFRVPMQYLRIYAEPEPQSEHAKDCGGAYVACWIKEQTRPNALHIAKGYIQEDGWRYVCLEEQCPVRRADYEGDERLEYYDQAVIDEHVFIVHTFPPEA
ncbi:MAG TPA: hypothetical protein PKK06_01550 [Phycisphaerae bacterium]|nr:hypothetical protein [Phycisphaerae bacterium]HNU44189.1 hypothetical protein [Phycisphaerae bacterium]